MFPPCDGRVSVHGWPENIRWYQHEPLLAYYGFSDALQLRKEGDIFECPSVETYPVGHDTIFHYSYGMNTMLHGGWWAKRRSEVPRPTEAMIFKDVNTVDGNCWKVQPNNQRTIHPHIDRFNLNFVDGHADSFDGYELPSWGEPIWGY